MYNILFFIITESTKSRLIRTVDVIIRKWTTNNNHTMDSALLIDAGLYITPNKILQKATETTIFYIYTSFKTEDFEEEYNNILKINFGMVI